MLSVREERAPECKVQTQRCKCHSCGKAGHLQAVCRSKPSQASEQPKASSHTWCDKWRRPRSHIFCSLYQVPVQGRERLLWKWMEFLWKWRLILETHFHWWLKTRTGATGHIGSCSSPSWGCASTPVSHWKWWGAWEWEYVMVARTSIFHWPWWREMGQVSLGETGWSICKLTGSKFIRSAPLPWRDCYITRRSCSSQVLTTCKGLEPNFTCTPQQPPSSASQGRSGTPCGQRWRQS